MNGLSLPRRPTRRRPYEPSINSNDPPPARVGQPIIPLDEPPALDVADREFQIGLSPHMEDRPPILLLCLGDQRPDELELNEARGLAQLVQSDQLALAARQSQA